LVFVVIYSHYKERHHEVVEKNWVEALGTQIERLEEKMTEVSGGNRQDSAEKINFDVQKIQDHDGPVAQ
jgi:hypothetical protein